MRADVLVIRNGPASEDPTERQQRLVARLDEGPRDVDPYSVFFCGDDHRRWFDVAEPLNGPSVQFTPDQATKRKTGSHRAWRPTEKIIRRGFPLATICGPTCRRLTKKQPLTGR